MTLSRAHVLDRRCIFGASGSFLCLLCWDLCSSSSVRLDLASVIRHRYCHCLCEAGRRQYPPGCLANIGPSTSILLYLDGHRCCYEFILPRSESYRYRAAECAIEHSVLCKLIVTGYIHPCYICCSMRTWGNAEILGLLKPVRSSKELDKQLF